MRSSFFSNSPIFPTMYCLLNGELIKTKDAVIPINDLAVLRGYGIFDFFRLSSGIPLFIDDHLERFYSSASQVRLEVGYTKQDLKTQILELISRNQMPVSGIRMVLTGGTGTGGYKIGKPNLIITQEHIHFPSEEMFKNGVKLITYEYLRELPHVKTINYMTGIWLQEEIARQGAFDVLYLHKGQVHELTRSNIFIINAQNEIITPNDQILHGVTRKQVIKSIQGKYRVTLRSISLEELYTAKEVFLTGTTKKVLPIRQIDEQVYGEPGDVTREVMRLFDQVEEKKARNTS